MSYFDLLRTFTAIYRTGSVTNASKIVGLTQPAVTQQLRALETQLNRRLFVRNGRGIQPLPAADNLAREISPLVDALEQVYLAARTGGDEISGTVHIGSPLEFLSYNLLPSLHKLPSSPLYLRFRTGVADDIVDWLADGDIDIGVATQRIDRSNVDYTPLYEESFVFVASPDWKTRLPSILSGPTVLATLKELPFLAYSEDLPIIRRMFRHGFGVEPIFQAKVIVPDLNALKMAAIAGIGLTVLPSYLCKSEISNGQLVVLPLQQKLPTNTIFLAWNKYAIRQKRVQYTRDLILETTGRHFLNNPKAI